MSPCLTFPRIRLLSLAGLLSAVLLSLWFLPLAHAAPAEEQDAFERGQQAYAAGAYQDAARHYEEEAAGSGATPALLFNLGNAHAAAGDDGRARLAYERARLLDPRAEDLQQNLTALLDRAGLRVSKSSAREKLLDSLTAAGWGRLGLGGLALVALATLILGLRRSGLYLPRLERVLSGKRLLVAVGCGALLLALAIMGLEREAQQRSRSVVVGAQATLRISPQDNADALVSLPAGDLVRVRRTFGDYVFVVTADGRQGWLRQEAAERIG